MWKVILVIMMLVCSIGYANDDCGKGELRGKPESNILITPNGRVFRIVTCQRSPTKEKIEGSFSYNPMTSQMFIFQEGDMIPSIVFEVEEVRGE